jgi:hypothetical protein
VIFIFNYFSFKKIKGQIGNDKFLNNFKISVSDLSTSKNLDINLLCYKSREGINKYSQYLNIMINFENIKIKCDFSTIIKIKQYDSNNIALTNNNELYTWFNFFLFLQKSI